MPLVETLKRPIGPLPAWGWAVVLVGAYLLFKRLRSGSGTTAGVAVDQATAPLGSGGGGGVGSDPTGAAQAALDAINKQIADQEAIIAKDQQTAASWRDFIDAQTAAAAKIKATLTSLTKAKATVTTEQGKISRLQKLIDFYKSVKHRTPHQQDLLNADLAALKAEQKKLAGEQGAVSAAQKAYDDAVAAASGLGIIVPEGGIPAPSTSPRPSPSGGTCPPGFFLYSGQPFPAPVCWPNGLTPPRIATTPTGDGAPTIHRAVA